MNRIERQCFATSTAAHVALIATLAFLSFWAARHPAEAPSFQPIELISTAGVKLVDGVGAGGGKPAPHAEPPVARHQDPPAPNPATPPPLSRPARPRTPVPPVAEAHPADPVAHKDPPQSHRVKVADDVKSQDTDDRLKTKKAPKDTANSKKTRDIKVAALAKAPTKAELEARRREEAEARKRLEKEAEEAAEAAEAEARAARAKAAADAWRRTLSGIHSGLQHTLSGETDVKTSGIDGGGQVWLGYGSYLKAFYEARWKRPGSLPVPVAYVGVAITVTRDGRLARFEVIERSGIRALDDSVAEVLQSYRKLDPLPEGTPDAERVFRIKFKLEGITP
jgi:TonB family protein